MAPSCVAGVAGGRGGCLRVSVRGDAGGGSVSSRVETGGSTRRAMIASARESASSCLSSVEAPDGGLLGTAPTRAHVSSQSEVNLRRREGASSEGKNRCVAWVRYKARTHSDALSTAAALRCFASLASSAVIRASCVAVTMASTRATTSVPLALRAGVALVGRRAETVAEASSAARACRLPISAAHARAAAARVAGVGSWHSRCSSGGAAGAPGGAVAALAEGEALGSASTSSTNELGRKSAQSPYS